MRVVFLHTDFRIYWPDRLIALKSYLEEKGIELRVVEIAGQGSPYQFAATAHRPDWWDCLFPTSKIETLDMKAVRRAIVDKLDQLNPDIVFAGAIAFPSGASGVYWANKNKKKIVIFDDARLQDVPRSRLVGWVKKSIYTAVDAILCPSSAWIETFKHFGFREGQLFFGVNVVDNGKWQMGVTDSDHQLEGLPDRYILSVGRQIPKKNYLGLLQAYSQYCLSVKSPTHLVLVGEGEQRGELERFVADNNLDRVIFLPYQSQDLLKHIYQKASFFVLPSLHGETWGLVVNEAMASGLPVLVSNQVGCASTLVADGQNGYTFDPNNHDQLSKMVAHLSDLSDQERVSMGEKSREIISKWGLERFCHGVNDAIQFVSKSKKRKVNPLTKLILRQWYGRYRPV